MPNTKKQPVPTQNESLADTKFQAILKNRDAHFLEEKEKKLSDEFDDLKKIISDKIYHTPGEKLEINITKYNRTIIDKLIKYLQANNLTFTKEEPLHPEFGDDPRNKNDLVLVINLPPKTAKTSSLGMFNLKNVGEKYLTRKHLSAEYKAKIQIHKAHQEKMQHIEDDFYSGRIGVETYIRKWAENVPKGYERLLSINLSQRGEKECEGIATGLQNSGYQAEFTKDFNDFAPPSHIIHVTVKGKCEEDYSLPELPDSYGRKPPGCDVQ